MRRVANHTHSRGTQVYDLDGKISWRRLLGAGAVSTGLALSGRLFGQVESAARGGTASTPVSTHGLVIRNARALDAEAPLGALASFQTAPEHFFVRSHFGPPLQLPLAWTLTVDGEVARPTIISLNDIQKLGAQSNAVTLECAGNGRGVFQLPKTSGVQWEYGAVSTATWTGVPLGALLERAGLKTTAQHLWMEALDRAPLATVPKFLRSIPRQVALGDAFVAYEMNGRPIPLLHGGPLRLIVPGWFGMASTKWLTSIHARTMESDNYFMSHGYRYADQRPVQELHVKSVIASPLADQRVPAGRLAVKGQAWSGAGSGGIRAVDVSIDSGRTWSPARLVGVDQPGAWRSWQVDVALTQPGPQSVMARATSGRGAVQPLKAQPNPGGYGNNSIQEVRFHVVRAQS